jgi:hypothetical protein
VSLQDLNKDSVIIIIIIIIILSRALPPRLHKNL